MERIALFPGSFDPFTDGHGAIVARGLKLFDRIVIAVGVNSDKQYMFTADERVAMIRRRYAGESRVEALSYSDMTVDCCRRCGAQFILRGVRNARDLEYEQMVAGVNAAIDPSVETVLLVSDLAHKDISSTLVRERLMHASEPSEKK